jgi:hypothetical protein
MNSPRRLLPIGIQTLAKIRERDAWYVDKYRAEGLPIHLIGVEFSKKTRNVVEFEVELIN